MIRPAVASDAQSIADFQVAMALETESKNLDPPTVLVACQAVFEDPSKGFYLVSEEDGKVVGSLLVTFEWSDWRNGFMWYIQSVYVDKDWRRKGIFKSLYQEVMDLAKQRNVRAVRLYVEFDNEAAQSVYESLGMKRLPYYMYDIKVES